MFRSGISDDQWVFDLPRPCGVPSPPLRSEIFYCDGVGVLPAYISAGMTIARLENEPFERRAELSGLIESGSPFRYAPLGLRVIRRDQ